MGNLSISQSSIKVGEKVTISASIKNTGDESGTYEVVLKVNNQVVDTKPVILGPNQSTRVSFMYIPTNEGAYSIEVNSLKGSLTVSKETMLENAWPIIAAATALIIILTIALLKRKSGLPSADIEKEIKKYEEYLEKLEQLRKEGKVSEEVYKRLKGEYKRKLEELVENKEK